MTHQPGVEPSRRADGYPTSPYPGEIPGSAFRIERGVVRELRVPGDFSRAVTDLEAARAVPLLTYGSNACPGRLAEKFARGRDLSPLDGIVVTPAVLEGATTVWACNVNSRDAVPRTLIAEQDVRLAAHVLFLPEVLLPKMDRTEGRGHPEFYAAVRLDEAAVEMPNGYRWSGPLTYLGHHLRGPLMVDGAPLRCGAVSEVQARRFIETRKGTCGDQLLPVHEIIPGRRPLSSVPHPGLEEMLVPQRGV